MSKLKTLVPLDLIKSSVLNRINWRATISYLYFPISIIYMELVMRIHCYGTPFDSDLKYIIMFSIVFGLISSILITMWSRHVNRIVSIILMAAIFLILAVQAVYFTIFNTFMTLYSLKEAGSVFGEFWKTMLQGTITTIIPLIFLLLPLVILIIFGKRFLPQKRLRLIPIMLTLFLTIGIHVFTVSAITKDTSGVMSVEYIYFKMFSPDLAAPNFGVLTTTRLDIKQLLSQGSSAADISQDEPKPDITPVEPTIDSAPDATVSSDSSDTSVIVKEEYGMNIMEFDFDTLIANETDSTFLDMHNYFSNLDGTKQNDYTGIFEGYNLIWIVAEGFSSLALDETHTPTLCKLAGEGFVFNNFYNPVWGVSTSDGEYVTTTGLIPKAGVWSYSKSSSNDMPFGFGNMFSLLGYTARAYHNHTYTYYDRNLSHPNMGYIYKGLGNGLDVRETWPESDVEMMELTVPEYVNDGRFVTYYMTVSGHLNYNFNGNMMAYQHKSDVADLPYSEGPRAYIACQMEFDQAVEYLIAQLEEAGILKKTVIVISGDHYPYGLEPSQMEEITGEPIEKNFELYRSTLVIWNSEMETVEVDKYCSSLDVMPTLANLFGLDYDSRLIAGTDILSDSQPLVIFNNRSFISDYGRYNSVTDTFTAHEGTTVPDGFAKETLQIVNNKFKYSALILENDYYAKVFPDGYAAMTS